MKKAILLILIIHLFAILGESPLYGQKKVKGLSVEELINAAEEIKDAKPELAIQYLEQALNQSSRSKGQFLKGRIYYLLGDIYQGIEQYDAAQNRYLQALKILQKNKDRTLKDYVNARLGEVSVKRKDFTQGEVYFKQCIKLATSDSISLSCKEGLLDIYFPQNDADQMLNIISDIEKNYQLDSLGVARLNARKADYYLLNKDFEKVATNYNNSISNIPQNVKIKKRDIKVLNQTQSNIYKSQDVSVADKFSLRTDSIQLLTTLLPKALEIDNFLQLSDLYFDEEKWLEANSNIVKAENLIETNTNKKTVLEIYDRSIKINEASGNIEEAYEAQKKYIEANKALVADLESQIIKQVDIERSQNKIDLLQKDFKLEESNEALLKNQLKNQRIFITLLSLLLLGSLVFFYFLNKSVKEKRKANQLLYLKSLRNQMNPHFIFNALNSVNNFISQNDEKAANKFLANFSKLMRQVLDNSQKEFISFEEEISLNELYLELEHFRFRDQFDYTFNNEVDQTKELEIPPMLIQPFIENAVWHGLRYKKEKGELKVHVKEVNQHIVVTVQDNGIGRVQSKALKTKNQKKYKSTGLENINKRIALINEIYQKAYSVSVEDLDSSQEDTGTKVKIKIPIEHSK